MSAKKKKNALNTTLTTGLSTTNEWDNDDLAMSEDEEGGTRIGDIYIPPPIQPHCSTESKGPRLIITNIVIENFKSYAGQIDLGPFHPCSSAVIGPNGSGKSNVIDAMLFVFGYRAQKLRSKKLSVLMHNSTRHPNNSSCTVYVYFKQIIDKKNGEFEDVPNSDFIISRTAFKDNASYYSIDKKKVQFKEVAKLLRSHGVDLDHNRFLILQGEVESIAMMKPKGANNNECGLLEYLEDIIGTSRYIQPLLKINSKVEILNEERTEKHNRCKLSEREMIELEQPMKDAIEYLKNENQITRTKNLLYQKYLDDLNCQLQDLNKKSEEVNKVLADHDAAYEKIQEERLAKEAIIKDEIDKYEKLIKDKDDAEQQLRDATNKYAELQTSLKATNQRRKDAKIQIVQEEHKLIELKQIPEKNKNDIIACEKNVERFRKEKISLDEILATNLTTLKDETKNLIIEKEKYQTKLIDLQKVVDDSKAELTIAESELKMCQYNETTENRKLLTLKHSLEELKQTHTEKAQELRKNKKIVEELKPKLQESQDKMKSMENEENMLSKKLQDFNAEISESVNNMQASKSNNKVLNSLMEQKQKGAIPGILGRLGDLGGIDSKYDVAISTCCGRLDNILVDTVNTAQLCIEFLKKYDIGRASFIALEKVMHLQSKCNMKIQTPENVPRIFDLIRVEDQRVRPAFYFSLYDTLVSNDLEQGTRIAYGARRYRVVTLKGDLIETSGTMSGGGRTLLRGKMRENVQTKTVENLNVSFKSIENLQIQAQKMREQINYIQEQQSILEPEINSMLLKIRASENDIRKLTIDLKSIIDQLPRLEESIIKQEMKTNECKSDPVKVKNLQEIIESKKGIFNKSQIEADKIKIEADKIIKKINIITDTKVKDVQKQINTVVKQIDKVMGQISFLEVDITSSERNVKKTEDKIKNLNAEIIRAQDTIKSDSQLRDNYDKEAAFKTTQIEEFAKAIKLAQTNSSSVKKEIIILQKKESEGKLKRFELVLAVQEVDKQIAGVKDQMPRWKNSLRPLQLHEIPNTAPEDPLKAYTEDELKGYKMQELQYQLSVAEQNLIGNKPNLSVIDEYKKKHEKYLERVALLEDITTRRNEMRQLYDDVKKKRFNEFMQGYAIISKKVKEMYRTITFGGDAELELVDSMDPFIEGISFSVRPPKKSWKMISNLSGGEKTLSSLALVFALHYYKPSPLYVMDEIDAALDFKNVTIVANYIRERAKNAQFIIISLRSNMFEVCDILVGIYKVYDCSSSVAIKNIVPVFETVRPDENPEVTPSADDLFEQILRENNSPKSIPIRKSEIIPEPNDLLITSHNVHRTTEASIDKPINKSIVISAINRITVNPSQENNETMVSVVSETENDKTAEDPSESMDCSFIDESNNEKNESNTTINETQKDT